MKFLIQRASTWTDETLQPTSEAIVEHFTEQRQYRGEEPFNEECVRWWIELPDLEALMALVRKEYRIIIEDGETPRIQIYDDYIE